MQLPVPKDDAWLAELVRLAYNGEDIVLTERGDAAVRLVPVDKRAEADELNSLLRALHGSARKRFGPSAARSADFLYDDYGLPA